MTLGSLFAGVGGFDLGFERAGLECLWQVEINPFRRAVLATHWPKVKRYEDITKCGENNLERVDCITAGVPCQDWSVAGRRAGLEGSRSGLFFEVARILQELKPQWFVFENVPGLLSANEGRDIATVLDTLGNLGYTVDINLADSQNFSVPQRRRRIFLVCHHVDHLRRMKTAASVRTIGQCISEILLSALAEACAASNIGLRGLDLPKYASEGGLRKRMKLLGLTTEGDWRALLANWDARSLSFLEEQNDLDSLSIKEQMRESFQDIWPAGLSKGESELLSGHTEKSWRRIWGVLSGEASWSTTLTEISSTTPSPIFGCAVIASVISLRIARLRDCCLNCSDAIKSSLTALKGFTAYATQTNRSLFGDLRWIRQWRDFEAYSECLASEIERHLGAPCPGEVLFEEEGRDGNPETGEEARAEVAAAVTCGTGRVGSRGAGDGRNIVAASLTSGSGVTSNAPGRRREDDYNIVAHTLRAQDGPHEASDRGDGQTNLVVADTLKSGGIGNYPSSSGDHIVTVIQDVRGGTRDKTDQGQGIGIREGGPSYTLSKTEQHGVAYALRKDPGGTGQGHNTNYAVAFSLPSVHRGVGQGHNTNYVRSAPHPDGVRDFAGLPKGMDSPRYQALGDAVTVQVTEWIGRRIIKAHKTDA